MFILENEEIQTEDIAIKIKLMKRVMDRVFPKIEDSIKEEFIRLDSQMFVLPGSKSSLEQILFDYPHLKFIGQSSVLPDEWSEEKYFARSLLSFLFQEKI
jgi:hypothetical protein